jgi:antitoxin (DNA-binding transcriptional repressor) of toxin-antitoxin stability system
LTTLCPAADLANASSIPENQHAKGDGPRREDPAFPPIEAALAGEEVVIAKGDKPVVRLVPIPQGQFRFGVLPSGALGEGPDFFAPLDEDELAAWEGRS